MSKKELANTLFPSIKNLQSNSQEPFIVIPMDIEVDTSRDQSMCCVLVPTVLEKYQYILICPSWLIWIESKH